MKHTAYIILSILIIFTITGCGSSNSPAGAAVIDGPTLDLAEAQELELNQFYVKEWTGDGTRPFFSVYIQDGISEDYMVCAGTDDGLDVASEVSVYYGNLSIPMVTVDDAEDHNTPIFNIVIVADQDKPCPAEVADTDLMIATAQINFGELLDNPIEFGDGDAFVTFKGRGHDDVDLPDLEPTTTDALTVGEIYFTDQAAGDIIPNYYMVLYTSNGATYVFYSMIEPSDMPEMRQPRVIYSKLNLAFSDTDGISSDNNLLRTKARIELQRDDATVVGRTDAEYLGDIIGRKIDFENDQGYVKFRRISEEEEEDL